MRYLKILALLSVFLLSLSACGQRGPLYMPEKAPASNQDQSEAENNTQPQEDDAPESQSQTLVNSTIEIA